MLCRKQLIGKSRPKVRCQRVPHAPQAQPARLALHDLFLIRRPYQICYAITNSPPDYLADFTQIFVISVYPASPRLSSSASPCRGGTFNSLTVG